MPSPSRVELKEEYLEGQSESVGGGQVHGCVRHYTYISKAPFFHLLKLQVAAGVFLALVNAVLPV